MTDIDVNSIPEKYHSGFKDLVTDLERLRPSGSALHLKKAFELLVKKKGGEKTFYKKSTINATLNVAHIAVNEIGLGQTSVISLFLYKAYEDSAIDAIQISKDYSESVGIITEGLAKISNVDEETTPSQAENFRSLLLNLARDVRVILIRLSEQTEIMRGMRQMKAEDQYKIALESSFLYAPLAHRLGLYLIKSEMEDLSLKYTDRHTYSMIADKLAATMRARKSFISEFIAPIKEELNKLGFDFEIKGRPKSIHSIWNKMKKKEVDFEDIYDLFAIRIIVRTDLTHEKADCWQVYSTVTDIYQPNPLRLRDWISVPKTNGYESLHTTVIGPGGRWVEVQIRTERMNEIAEKGVAAHWKYKGLEGEKGVDQWLTKIREILDTPESDAANFIDDFKLSLYSKEIFVFTPKGDLRRFPENASVLDFAYDIHTDVGASCIGAKVNGKSVPIRYKMKNGDKIEILISKNQSPKLDWLNFVVTSKAQKKIRQRLNDDQTREAENGKEIIKRRFKNWKIDYNDDVIRRILKQFKYPNAQEFYCNVSNEKIDLAEIKELLSEKEEDTDLKVQTIEDLESLKKISQVKERKDEYLVIDEITVNVDYKLARCCSPIKGDNIFGFVTIGEGIKIHRTNCPNAVQLLGKYGYRVVNAKWTRRGPESAFPVDIQVTGEDYAAIMKHISEALAKDLKVSVRSISLESSEGMFSGKLSLLVKDIDHLDNLITRLKRIRGIYSVSRHEPA